MHIEFLRDKNQIMPKIENPSKVTSMKIWHCNFHSLKSIHECNNLEQLSIATLPESDFEFLSKCPNLKLLSIVHLPEIESFESFESFPILNQLETLSLSTLPSWDSSGKKTVVDSLAPLANLPNLKHVELFGVVPEDLSSESLSIFDNLQSARFSKYPKRLLNAFYKQSGVSDDWAPEIAN